MKKYFICLLGLFFCFTTAFAQQKEEVVPAIVLGGGVGGITSSLYLSRSGIKPLVIEGKNPGGVITFSHKIQNWPGEEAISGSDLFEKLKSQAEKCGAIFVPEEVVSVDFSSFPYRVSSRSLIDTNKIIHRKTMSCIIAMGSNPNKLKVEGEEAFWGNGISSCAVCDGFFYKDKTVAIIGGGDASLIEAEYLSNIAKKVYIVVRKDKFRAKDKEREKMLLKMDNVEVLFETQVKGFKGKEGTLSQLVLTGIRSNRISFLDVDGVFLAIGAKPNSDIFLGQLDMDDFGHILLMKNQETSKEGIFAIGDIADSEFKQAISAAGDGAKAAIQAHKFLLDKTKTALAKQEQFEKMKEENEISSKVIDIKSSEHFEEELANTNLPVVVDFYANWCGPCRMIGPLLSEKAKVYAGKIKILKVNVDHNQKLCNRFHITMMPTILIFDKDKNLAAKKKGTDEIHSFFAGLDKQNEIDEYIANL